jgi:hypothetical protein
LHHGGVNLAKPKLSPRVGKGWMETGKRSWKMTTKDVKLDEQTVNACKEKIQEYMSEEGKGGFLEGVLEKKTLGEAIKMAAISIDKNGKKHPHQWRLSNDLLKDFAKELIKVKDKMNNAKDFHELFELVNEKKIKGIKDMTVYDVTLRIGEYLKKKPDRIYLHAGTKEGIKELFKIMDLNELLVKRKSIYKNELPEPFRSCKLTPSQLEDFFCIYKDELGKSGNKAMNKFSRSLGRTKCRKRN